MRVSFSKTIDDSWAKAERVRTGAPASLDKFADMHVLVEGKGGSRLVIDLFEPPSQAYPFSDVQVWQGLVVAGYGSSLYIIRLRDRVSTLVPLDGYFGSLHVEDNLCLVCSASELLRLAPDGSVMWRRGELGADGVQVSDVRDGVIHARGQWDPPDAEWKEFRLDLLSGKPV